RPRMWMLLVLPAELGEKLADFRLKIVGQRRGDRVNLLELDFSLCSTVQLVDDVREPLEVRIDRAVEGQLGVGNREAADERIVIASLKEGEIRVGGPPGVNQPVKPDVHVRARGAGGRCGRGRRLSWGNG